MSGVWRDGKVPDSAIGTVIEHWSKVDNDSWFEMVGLLSVIDGEPGMKPGDVTKMEFHSAPPIPTEGHQCWRTA